MPRGLTAAQKDLVRGRISMAGAAAGGFGIVSVINNATGNITVTLDDAVNDQDVAIHLQPINTGPITPVYSALVAGVFTIRAFTAGGVADNTLLDITVSRV